MQFDASYEPIVVGKRLVVASARTNSVTAYDTDSGVELWRFLTDTPVRLAPFAHQKKIYFGADDGCLRCLDLTDGREIWKIQAAPTNRLVLGKSRLTSVWPARGGVDRGHCLVVGGESNAEIIQMLKQSQLQMVVIEPKRELAQELRAALDR